MDYDSRTVFDEAYAAAADIGFSPSKGKVTADVFRCGTGLAFVPDTGGCFVLYPDGTWAGDMAAYPD